MKRAIQLAHDFTLALEAAQADTLARLDALAGGCAKAVTAAENRAEELKLGINAHLAETKGELEALRAGALRLAAQIRDGSDDGAQLVQQALKMPTAKSLTIATDAEQQAA